MRVAAIYPAFDLQINEMALVWRTLGQAYGVHCTVASLQSDRLKASQAAAYERDPDLEIRRYPSRGCLVKGLSTLAREARADVIFCAVTHNMPAAIALQRMTGAPIVLHTEYWSDDAMLLPRRYHLGLAPLRACVCGMYRRWLARRACRILCSDPAEPCPSSRYRSLAYLPWPHPAADSVEGFAQRDRCLAVYIGSISRAKGAATLASYSAALQEVHGMDVSIVGPAADRAGARAVRALQRGRCSGRVNVLDHSARHEAMALLRRALFALVPGRRQGWGLIGDAWANGTPVLASAEHYDLKDGQNCLVARSTVELCAAAQALQKDPALWGRLSEAGRETVLTRHNPELTADVLVRQLAEAGRR